ncbi:MAG TPA: aldehyde ferredoxin oxidoreductase C-terminal domain-containing protein [Herpetosiphonaceae bacterium]
MRIHLETHGQQRRALPPTWQTLFGGGRGLTGKLLAGLPADLSPLAPENPLIFAPGLLQGTGALGTAGIFVGTIAPLTGVLSQGWAEGDWGNALRRAGLSLLIVAGVAEDWSIIRISPDGAEIHPAANFVGLDTVSTAVALRAEYGEDARVLALGPAGEAGVAYATPVVDGRYPVEPAGAGAVMAAKRIKAIVVHGGEPLSVHDAAGLRQLEQTLTQRCETSPLAVDVRRFGSAAYINLLNDHGAVTGRNGQDGVFGGMLALSRSTLALRGKQHAHGNCPLPCYAEFVQRDGSPLPRPDLEAVLGFGVRCGIADLEVVLLANERCLRLGLDVTATAAAIAFLMECQQQGLHRTPALPWADGQVLLDVIEKIGRKEGVGGVLSLGVGEMQAIFWSSEVWAPQVYGGAMSPIDPRPLPILALHLATSTWPGDYRMALPLSGLLPAAPEHLPDFSRAPDVPVDVSRLLWHERFGAALDALGLCRRWGLLAYAITPGEMAELASLVTGVKWTSASLAKLGERIVTLERMTLARNGVNDTLPRRWRETSLSEGRAAGQVPDLTQLLAQYYTAHGWDASGQPSEARLQSLDLGG